ncbi:MAG: trypsin-like serine protease [Chloroflexota bacterium]
MQSKYFKAVVTLLLIAVVATTLSLPGQPALAGEPQAGGDLAITSTDSGLKSVGAPRPWTAAELKAAIPYPMADLAADEAAYSVDALAGPDGPAGTMPGARPGGKLLSDAAELGAEELSGVTPLAFSYPAPFTRFNVEKIAAYTVYPFRTVGKLFFKQYGTSYVCSASVLGPRGIVTAGHCVHAGNGLSTGWSTNVVFIPAYRNGAAPYGQWSVPVLRTFTDWYNNGDNGDFDHDWGAGAITQIKNGKNIGQTVGYLGYAWNQSRNQDWWLLGYPQASPFTGKYMVLCTSAYAYNSPFYSGGPAPVTVGCDATGGTSGGPWIKSFGSGNYVNGVNSHRATARPKELSSPYADGSTKTSIFDWARNY